MDFLPVNKNDMANRQWEQCDFILISGDAYVDHPSWGERSFREFLKMKGSKSAL